MTTFIKILLRVLVFGITLALISENIVTNVFHSGAIYPILISYIVTWVVDPFTDVLTSIIVKALKKS